MSYPGHRSSICEGFLCDIFIYHQSKHWTFVAFQILCSFSFCVIHIAKTAIFTHTQLYRFQSTLDLTGNSSATASYDFENPINLAEDEGEDDCEVPGELARLLLQEERAIQPHEEPVETVNLGTETDRKEVKIGANLELSVKQRLI